MDNSRSIGDYYYRPYWAPSPNIRHYLHNNMKEICAYYNQTLQYYYHNIPLVGYGAFIRPLAPTSIEIALSVSPVRIPWLYDVERYMYVPPPKIITNIIKTATVTPMHIHIVLVRKRPPNENCAVHESESLL